MITGIIAITFSVLYAVFLFWCQRGWTITTDHSEEIISENNIKVVVIVAVRNEAMNISTLLDRLAKQNYKTENYRVIIVDDHSTDETVGIAKSFFGERNIQNGIILSSPEYSKKKAIAYAISHSDAELIITTDADSAPGNEWISSMVQEYVRSGAYFICGPVQLQGQKHFREMIQSVEFTGLSAIAAAGISMKKPMLCNGANLAFSKKIFHEVNGFDKSKSVSGDDTQLLLKISDHYPGKISFLKDKRAIIKTGAISQNADLWQQRKRWASKIPTTLSSFTIMISVLAWFVHASLLIQLFNVFSNYEGLLLFLTAMTIKVVPEIILLKGAGRFFDQKIPSWIVIVAQPFYCTYIVLVGLLSPFGTYKWKGRRVK